MFRFAQLPFFAADAAGLCACYGACAPGAAAAVPPAPPPFRRDGLLLLHRGATYAPGRSPLALAWRDAACSAWSLDIDDEAAITGGANPAPLQRVLLRLLASPPGALGSGDEPPAVLGSMPGGWVAGDPPAGALLRCELAPGGLRLDGEGQLCEAQLRVLGLASGRRAEADTCNRVRPACARLLPQMRHSRATPLRAHRPRRSWRSTLRAMRRCGSRHCSLQHPPRHMSLRGTALPTLRLQTWTLYELDGRWELAPWALGSWGPRWGWHVGRISASGNLGQMRRPFARLGDPQPTGARARRRWAAVGREATALRDSEATHVGCQRGMQASRLISCRLSYSALARAAPRACACVTRLQQRGAPARAPWPTRLRTLRCACRRRKRFL